MRQSPLSRATHLLRRLREIPRDVAETRSVSHEVRDSQHRVAHQGHLDSLAVLDAVNYSIRRRPLTGARTKVLVLVHHIEAWDSLGSLVDELSRADDFEVVVASIPRHFRGAEGFVDEDLVHEGLASRGVPHLRFSHGDDGDRLAVVRALSPDIIFRQSQWDADVPSAYSTRNLAFARLCLVPYEMIGLIENVPLHGVDDTAVDERYHRIAWRVFCAGEHARAVAAAHGSLGGAQFVATGHPKADRLRSAQPGWPVRRPDGQAPRQRIVWSAHHTVSEGWTNFGMTHLVVDDMLAWARSAPDVDFVFMPHPALTPFVRDDASLLSGARYDAFVSDWCALPNATIYEGGDYAPVLAASDVMVTDGLSMLVEYQFMGKPLVFLERPDHRPFNDAGRLLLSGVKVAPDVDQARSIISLLTDEDRADIARRQSENVRALFHEGPAAPRILAELREAVALDQVESAR